jgi:hypothetical protein
VQLDKKIKNEKTNKMSLYKIPLSLDGRGTKGEGEKSFRV